MRTQKKAYISGKITGLPDLNRNKFNIAASYVRQREMLPVLPHDITAHLPLGSPWEHYMKVCIAEMMKCDVVVVLNDWHLSRGAQIEVELAMNVGIPVLELLSLQPIKWKVKVLTEINGVLLNVRL